MQITLDAVSFAYPGRSVFEDLTLSIDCHQAIGLTGSNGCGKTTLGKLIMGLLQPSRGSICLDQVPICSFPLWDIGRRIGYLFQNFTCQLFSSTVLAELLFPFELMNRQLPGLEEKCLTLLQSLNLMSNADASTLTLSMGEKQRLALASLLISQPSFLILDEPTASLDSRSAHTLLGILENQKAAGVGMLVISHDLAFLQALCDRFWTIETGGNLRAT
jgi:energy-coupling factor transport system ATP-binding protein